MNKLYFVGMAGPNSLEDLKELIEPIKQYFNGIIFTLHDCKGKPEEEYLESVKSGGTIIQMPFSKRHDYARNAYLFCGPMKEGDWFCQVDLLERLNSDFAAKIPTFIKEMKDMGINAAYYYGKIFLCEFSESLIYIGSPHEGIQRNDQKMAAIELSHMFPDETKVRQNVRPIKRPDKFNFLLHYLKYFLYPYGSNHCLLGIEKRPGDPRQNFAQRDSMRLAFREHLTKINIPLDAERFKDWLIANKDELDKKMIEFINKEKILNDVYRYYVLNDHNFNDDHDINNMIKIG